MSIDLTQSLSDIVPLTDDQEEAVSRILDWLAKPVATAPEFKLGGYAGTGKTTVMKELLRDINRRYYARVSAFTGKACHVLQRKGVDASTMHSLMYNVIENGDGTFSFERKLRLEGNPYLIIVDEASMVSRDLYNDLCSFKTKRLFVGDPGQLEPVGDNPNLMAKPDFVLEHIHRQAEKSPIIQFATHVRKGGPVNRMLACADGDALSLKPKVLRASDYLGVDQVICAKNKTRKDLNKGIRHFKGYPSDKLVVGDKIICLRNNRSLGVFNGMLLWVDTILREGGTFWEVHLHDELNRKFQHIKLWKEPFILPLVDDTRIPSMHMYADYGYVITCHKSQGSEWDSVLVQDEWLPPSCWDMKRWRYTAITRAAKKLVYCI